MVWKAQTSVACLACAYSVGWNIILKSWLLRLKDVHNSHLNHDFREHCTKVFTHLMF